MRAAALVGAAVSAAQAAPAKTDAQLKLGLYSITYLGVWYSGAALTIEEVIDRAKKFGYDGVEIDGKRPHGDPLDCRSTNAATSSATPKRKASSSTPSPATTISAAPCRNTAKRSCSTCAS